MWATERLHVKSNGDDEVLDLTRKLQDAVDRHHLQHGQVLVFVPGSTAGGGHSHVRASLLGPSVTLPVEDAKLVLGTWQQVVLIDFDVRPREREVVVQLSGEKS